jgi:hypothetical protein
LVSSGPKIVQVFWCGGFGIFNLARRRARREQGEYSAGNHLWVGRRIAVHSLVNALEKRAAAPGLRPSARMPAVIVEAAQ